MMHLASCKTSVMLPLPKKKNHSQDLATLGLGYPHPALHPPQAHEGAMQSRRGTPGSTQLHPPLCIVLEGPRCWGVPRLGGALRGGGCSFHLLFGGPRRLLAKGVSCN